jgi:hypothetical protein
MIPRKNKSTAWRVLPDGTMDMRTNQDRVLDAAARGLPVPKTMLAAAQCPESWARYTRADWEATRWAGGGDEWWERLYERCPGWDCDPPGWYLSEEEANAAAKGSVE